MVSIECVVFTPLWLGGIVCKVTFLWGTLTNTGILAIFKCAFQWRFYIHGVAQPTSSSRTFWSSKRNSVPVTSCSSSPQTPQLPVCFLFPWIYWFWTYHWNVNMEHAAFCVWLFFFHMMFLRLIYATFMTKYFSLHEWYHILAPLNHISVGWFPYDMSDLLFLFEDHT